MEKFDKDKRLARIKNDPRFYKMPRNEQKLKIDKRFQPMFKNKNFKIKYQVDKRGKPISLTNTENMKKFYDISSEEEEEEEDVEEGKKEIKSSESSSDSSDEEEEDDDDDEEEEKLVEEIPWSELDKDAERIDQESKRLAVCNMDWDRIKAKDIFVLLNSFKPSNGSIISVKIYQSDYGIERMKQEAEQGPIELIGEAVEEEEEDEEEEAKIKNEDDDEKIDRFKLRQYQLNRLKYFYSVVECDRVETASKIYNECDSLEYETSCTRIDLRFIPDDVQFDDREPYEVCLEAPDPQIFKPNIFFTTALNQTKVECTWDETPRERKLITMRKYKEEDIDKYDYKNLVASSSDSENEEKKEEEKEKKKRKNKNKKDEEEEELREDDEGEDGQVNKYKRLLSLIKNNNGDEDDDDDDKIEVSWDTIDKNRNKDEKAKKSKKRASKKKKLKMLKEDAENEGVESKKEKAELSLITMDDTDILLGNNKRRKDQEDEDNESKKEKFKFNPNDPRFSQLYSNPLFHIDPSTQGFKKTKAFDDILSVKASLAKDNEKQLNSEEIEAKERTNVDLLIKSIKNKTKMKNANSSEKFKKK